MSQPFTNSTALAVQYVLGNEGGFVDNPRDHGRATNFGVTLAALTEWRGKAQSVQDVQNLTLAEATSFYNETYVLPLQLSLFDRRVATAVLDVCVNMGMGPGVKLLQRSCGQLTDGFLGNVTRQAVQRMPPLILLSRLIVEVQNAYIRIAVANPAQLVFLQGWLTRSQRLMTLMT